MASKLLARVFYLQEYRRGHFAVFRVLCFYIPDSTFCRRAIHRQLYDFCFLLPHTHVRYCIICRYIHCPLLAVRVLFVGAILHFGPSFFLPINSAHSCFWRMWTPHAAVGAISGGGLIFANFLYFFEIRSFPYMR